MTQYPGDFVERQIGFLSKTGASVEDVTRTLTDALGKEALAGHQAMLSGAIQQVDEPMLARFVETASELGVPLDTIHVRANQLKRELRELTESGWRLFGGLMTYVISMTSVVLIVVTLFQIFVVPQFASLFADFGADLPELTRMLLHPLSTPVIVGLPLLILAGTAFVITVGKRVTRLRTSVSGWMFRVPFLTGPARQVVLWTYAAVFATLFESRISAEQALQRSRTVAIGEQATLSPRVRRELDELERCLQAAAALGTLDRELEHWRAALELEYPLSLATTRQRLGLAITIALGLLVGFVVVAMYLPIFKMGQVI